MKWSILFLTLLFLSQTRSLFSQHFPGKQWEQYSDPEDAGFSKNQLMQLEKTLENEGSAAFLIIQDGKIVFNWGATNQRFRQASIRKSYLSASFGIFQHKQNWDLNQTLEELGIDDIQALSPEEKQARIIDLLGTRSGVYHPSAYNTRSNAKNLPERGSHAPGTFWYYNNWDFNVLLSIFEQKSGRPFFRTFKKQVADPLQMEDFRLFDTYYRFEPEVSQHPAYLFKMTARDMARFGWLFFNEGRWKNQQIVPKEWIKKSTRRVTPDPGPRFAAYGNYGLLWWITNSIEGHPMYYASGAGGQRICIFPNDQLLMVHLTDTYQNRNIPQERINLIMSKAIKAKVSKGKTAPPVFIADYPKVSYPDQKVNKAILKKLEGSYQHPVLGEMVIKKEKNNLIMTAGIGRFRLFAESKDRFIVEDMMIPLRFEKGNAQQKNQIEARMGQSRSTIEEVIFYY